jgi:twitching motility protein PilT
MLDAMRDGELEGMQCFDGELEKLVRAGAVDMPTAMLHATNPGNLRVQLADIPETPKEQSVEDSLIERF